MPMEATVCGAWPPGYGPATGPVLRALTRAPEAIIRVFPSGAGTPRPHVQRFATALKKATGVSDFGTYVGHHRTLETGLDIFHRIGDHRTADAICDFAVDNWDRFNIEYMISRRRIRNLDISEAWRAMEDRGSPTDNHEDHGHLTFRPTAPDPNPIPAPEENDMAVLVSYERNVWATDGLFKRRVASPSELAELARLGAVDRTDPPISDEMFNLLRDVNQ